MLNKLINYYREGKMKKILLVGVILAMVLTLILPSAAMAAKPVDFYTAGTISDITPGTVSQIGHTDWWRVSERDITGVFAEGPEASVSGAFTLTYQGKFKLSTQEGKFKGDLICEDSSFKIDGNVDPLEFVPIGNNLYAPKLTISGDWKYQEGGKGKGEFSGWLIFNPTPDGHVDYVIASSFVMTGKIK
jgi:hypothetical protein